MSGLPLLRAGSTDADSAESAALFDGAAKRQAMAGPLSAAAENRGLLTAELRKHITLNDHGSPAERAVLDSMVSRLLESATAREVAAQFINENAGVVVSLEEIPGSAMMVIDGKKTLQGGRGYTAYREVPPRVGLNKLFMQYERDSGVGTLAHEMLGHALERQRLGENALAIANRFATSEEENARLIGWLTRTELGVKPEDEIWAYVENPAESMDSIKLISPAYAIKLTREEMKDPAAVYKSRLLEVDKKLEQLPKTAERYKLWLKMADHFVDVHKMDASSFRNIRAELNDMLEYLPTRHKDLLEVGGALITQLELILSNEGQPLLSLLEQAADSDYYKQREAIMKERLTRLEGLLIGQTQGSTPTPPEAGQLSWDQFMELAKKDTCVSGAPTPK